MKTAIQHNIFPDGGFVLHRVIFASENGKFSAWFDKAGNVVEAEQILNNRINGTPYSRPVKKDGPIWRMLRTVGVRYVKTS